jgi:hypothetical protein
LEEVVAEGRRRGHKIGRRSSLEAPELCRIRGCHTRSSSRAPHAFRGRHSILVPHAAPSLLACRGRHHRLWVKVCHRRLGLGVRCCRSPTSGVPLPLARLRALGSSSSLARPGPRRRSLFRSRSRRHRASESGNCHHDSGSRNRCRRASGLGSRHRLNRRPEGPSLHAPGWAPLHMHRGGASKTKP